MHRLFVAFLFFFSLQGYSQTGYNISLVTDLSDIPLSINGVITKRPLSYGRVVVNDSASFLYGFGPTKKDPMKKNKNYGSKVFNHAEMAFKNSLTHYIGVGHNTGRKDFFLIDTVKKFNWVITAEEKKILGYTCKKAFWVNEYLVPSDSTYKWHADSTVAWYTTELNRSKRIEDFRGLPGVILESFYPTPFGKRHVYAIDIKEDSFTISVPLNIPVLTSAEFKRLKR